MNFQQSVSPYIGVCNLDRKFQYAQWVNVLTIVSLLVRLLGIRSFPIRCPKMYFMFVAFLTFAFFPFGLTQISWLLNSRIDIQELKPCKDQGSIEIVWDLRLNRRSKDLVVIEGQLYMQVPLDSKIGRVLTVAEKRSGGWKEQTFVFRLPEMCLGMLVMLRSAWTNFWVKAGVPSPVFCPIKQGNYTLKGYPTTEFEKNSFPSYQSGVFKLDLEFTRRSNSSRIGCLEFIVSTGTQQ